MRFLNQTLAALLCATSLSAAAALPLCETVSVSARILPSTVSPGTPKSMAQLSLMRDSSSDSELTLGYTDTALRSEVHVALRKRQPATKEACLQPEVSLGVGLEPIRMYVASEIPQGSCIYAEVYRRQTKHTELYFLQLEDVRRSAQDAIAELVLDEAPEDDETRATEFVAAQVSARLEAALDESWDIIQEVHADADSQLEPVSEPCMPDLLRFLERF